MPEIDEGPEKIPLYDLRVWFVNESKPLTVCNNVRMEVAKDVQIKFNGGYTFKIEEQSFNSRHMVRTEISQGFVYEPNIVILGNGQSFVNGEKKALAWEEE